LVIIFLLAIVTIRAAIPSPLIVVERDNDNNTIIAKYSWDSDDTFERIQLVDSFPFVRSATFSSSRQILFMSIDDFKDGYQTLLTYDLKNGKLTPYRVNTWGGPFNRLSYFEETDELWMFLYTWDYKHLFTCQLQWTGSDYQTFGCNFDMMAPDDFIDYAYGDQNIYFALGGIKMWSFHLVQRQLVIDALWLGGHLAFDNIDKHIYYTNAIHLSSMDPITKKGQSYMNQWPFFTEFCDSCSATMVDGKYVITIFQEGVGRMLSISKPGGANFYQKITNRAAWVWKWPSV